jgi:hypothetical protein
VPEQEDSGIYVPESTSKSPLDKYTVLATDPTFQSSEGYPAPGDVVLLEKKDILEYEDYVFIGYDKIVAKL